MNEFSHKRITELALKNTFLNKKSEEIKRSVILPDIDENQDAYVHHFYNPITNTNYQNSEDSAKARCIAHFGNFLITKNLDELGRSIHFLEDICTPVHVQYEDSVDAIIHGKLHIDFENQLDTFCNYFSFNSEEYKNLNNLNTLSRLINYCALESVKNYYLYRDKGKKEPSLKNTFKLACCAVRHIVLNLADNDKLTARIIKIKGKKPIGILIKYHADKCKEDVFELAPLSSNYRLRINNNREIIVFKKFCLGCNFIMDEVIKLNDW